MRLAVPVMCVYTLRTNLTMEILRGSWKYLLIPAVSSLSIFGAASLIGRRMHLPASSRAVFATLSSASNALFIGFIDDERAPYAVSIVLENMGAGGEYAAPLAHDIFEYLIEHLQNAAPAL